MLYSLFFSATIFFKRVFFSLVMAAFLLLWGAFAQEVVYSALDTIAAPSSSMARTYFVEEYRCGQEILFGSRRGKQGARTMIRCYDVGEERFFQHLVGPDLCTFVAPSGVDWEHLELYPFAHCTAQVIQPLREGKPLDAVLESYGLRVDGEMLVSANRKR